MTTLKADTSHLRKSIIGFAILAAILIVLGLVLDTGIGLKRRSSDITLEGVMILFGMLSLLPVVFALLRFSPDRCALQVDNQSVVYTNIGFGWPIIKTYAFTRADVESVLVDDTAVKINFISGSQHADADKSEDDADLTIEAPLFGLSADELSKLITG